MFSTLTRDITLYMLESDEIFKTSGVALTSLKNSFPGAIIDCVVNFNEGISQAGGTVSLKFDKKQTEIVIELPNIAPEDSNFDDYKNATQIESHSSCSFFILKISQTTKLQCKSVETVDMLLDKLPAEIFSCIHENLPRVSHAGGNVKFSFNSDQTQILVKLPPDSLVTVSPTKPPRIRTISAGNFNTYV